MDAVTVPQEGSPPVPTHVYRCTYGSDYPSGCPCRRHNHAAPAPPAPRMAMEVAEVCVTSCPTDAMQCGRYVQSSPGVPQYAQAQGGAFTISKVKATEGGHLTPYWLLDKTSSHWDLDGYVSVDAIARARNWSQKSLPIRLSGASLATRLSGAGTRSHRRRLGSRQLPHRLVPPLDDGSCNPPRGGARLSASRGHQFATEEGMQSTAIRTQRRAQPQHPREPATHRGRGSACRVPCHVRRVSCHARRAPCHARLARVGVI